MKIRCALSYQATTHSHYFILTREKEKILKVESDVIWLSIYAAKIKRKKYHFFHGKNNVCSK